MGYRVAIIDYEMGNLFSINRAMEVLGVDHIVTSRAEEVKGATHVILPGVGSFESGINNLRRLGLDKILDKEVFLGKKPFLGICLGMQLTAEEGLENGRFLGLGWVKGKVELLEKSVELRIPHIGWNNVKSEEGFKLFRGIPQNSDFYFVHSYVIDCQKYVVKGVTEYGVEFPSMIQLENIYGVQFHPEKSEEYGLKLLRNFVYA